MAGRFPTAGESKEHCTHHSGFLNDRRIKLDDAIPNMAQAISDTLSIISGGNEIAGAVATEYTGVVSTETELTIIVDPVDSPQQGDNDGDFVINIGHVGENVPTHKTAMQLVARGILTMALLTLVMDIRTALYKTAGGVVFGHNKLAYYASLAIIFALGASELFTGLWISFSDLIYIRRLWIGGIVLFLSIWPFVGILGIAGFP